MDCVLLAELSGLMSTLWMIAAVAAGLGLVIFVHELGHFLAAKACGVKCEKFYIGFDIPMSLGPIKLPSAICRFRWGETEYGVGILPLGGYVKMLGQDDNPRNQAQENERIKVRKGEQAATAPAATNPATPPAADEPCELDPRSFPAKPVWQRMVIISAGVVMNLIFAVIFAATAYGMGVSYTPCTLGGTSPGDPAWIQGHKAADKIVQLGRQGHPDEHLRFDKDLMISVTLHGSSHSLDLLIRPAGGSEPKWVSIQPTARLKDFDRPATLGVRPASTTRLDATVPCDPERKTDEGYKLLQGNDEIVAVNGHRLPRDAESGVIFEHHLEPFLARHMTEPLNLTLRRQAADGGSPQDFDITVPPTPARTLGVVMEAGPIVGVRTGTPAERAGFQAGDIVVSMAGQPIGDPFTLAQRLLPLVGQEVEFGVVRGDAAKPLTLRATPVPPSAFEDNFGPGAPVGLDCLGIAFEVRNVVKEVEADGPAARGGLQPGDEIASVQFLVDDKPSGEPIPLIRRDEPGLLSRLFGGEQDATEKRLPNWSYVQSAVNAMPNSVLDMTVRRRGTEVKVTVKPELSEQWFHPGRGLNTTAFSQTRRAQSWSEAAELGLRETELSLVQVVAVLHRLFTGQISPKSMGGPIMIAKAAGSEASQGVARLLIFLTFLSANLAVLNFLPVPALDGGHMVFLLAELVRGKPVNERLQIALTLIGVGCLLSLMVLVFALDIQRFILSG